MSRLFKAVVITKAERLVNVLAENAEEAQAKLVLAEGEVLAQVSDEGEVVA